MTRIDHRRITDCERGVIAAQKRLHRTWTNSFEREAIADSRKEFALAFAETND